MEFNAKLVATLIFKRPIRGVSCGTWVCVCFCPCYVFMCVCEYGMSTMYVV